VNERVGTELSAAARQVIADARGVDDPTAEDEARVKARWLAGIAAGAGVSSLSEAVRAAASTGWGLKAAALAAAALAAATAGVYLGWPQHTEAARETPNVLPAAPVASVRSEPSAPAPVPPVAEAVPAAPEIAEPAAAPVEAKAAPVIPSEPVMPAAEPGVAARSPATPARAHPAAAARKVPAAAAPAVAAVEAAPAVSPAAPLPSGQLGEEISLISQIRGQLQAGAPSRALQQLAEYRRRFAQPNLAMEAEALRVDALCQAGEREAARAAAAAFSTNWPASPLQQRVSAACR
jgi:hypothetical protein